jgi:hypothetical protein
LGPVFILVAAKAEIIAFRTTTQSAEKELYTWLIAAELKGARVEPATAVVTRTSLVASTRVNAFQIAVLERPATIQPDYARKRNA